MPEVRFRTKCATKPGEQVRVVGSDPAIGAWDPQKSKVELLTDAKSYPWWSGKGDLGAGQHEFKFVVVNGGDARWEGIKNRALHVPDSGTEVEAEFDRERATEKASSNGATNGAPQPGMPLSTPAGKPPPPTPAGKPAASLPPQNMNVPKAAVADAFAQRIADENSSRRSYRQKLDLSRAVLEGGEVSTLSELACLQAYLTWVSSGQIKCEEDGGHHRPCAHADASRKISSLLWQFAARGDAERFIARRVFPSLPSYADHFTCAVPMTRIRDIAHRGDIPQDLKNEIKHTLQNKLHRCADPGDLVTCEKLIQRCRQENRYSGAFMHEFEIFYKELKEFFNASGLDDQAQQAAAADGNLRPAVDRFLSQKQGGANAADQLSALVDLRRLVAPRAEAEQLSLLFDLELEKYAFVLLSQVAGDLERGGQRSSDWWQRLLHALRLALAQSELSGIAAEECSVVSSEVAAAAPDAGNAAKVPFVSLRLISAADRALRICFALTQQLENAYNNVPALGQALRIDSHAVSVFVEAEMRASILFQVSKLVQLVMQQAKRDAKFPLWTAISAGSVCGRQIRCNALSEVWSRNLPAEGAIILCNEAGGDEELPPMCRGVVVARDMPVLSHLALRARQLGAVFGCTAERQLFDGLLANAPEGAAVRLTVEAVGTVRMEKVSDEELKASAGTSSSVGLDGKPKLNGTAAPKVGALNLVADDVVPVVDLASSPQTAGSKAASSGKLESVADSAGFKAPKGLAVPFGVMAKAVQGPAIEAAVAALQAALEKEPKKVEECALAARAAVEKSAVPAKVIDALISGLPPGTLRVAVRSSANSEDLEGVSGAGLHDSILGVDATNRAEMERAVQQVWGSMFTLRAVQSRNAAKMPLFRGIAMGVLVQPMVSLQGCAYAFIVFSKNVVEKDAGAVYLELCVGLGETLASANEPGTPYRLVVRKEAPHAVKVLSLASFSFGLQDVAGGPVPLRVDYSKERLSTDPAFLEQLAREVAIVAIKVEQSYGVPMDMEGVVLERKEGREVHLVQARPIVEG